MSRCTGHCCKSFQIQLSPDEIREAALHERAGTPGRLMIEDIVQLDDMLIYLGFGHPSKFCDGYKSGPGENTWAHFYTCKHLQKNGDCGNYANRPGMCRRYPSALMGCEYKACTRTPDKLTKKTARDALVEIARTAK